MFADTAPECTPSVVMIALRNTVRNEPARIAVVAAGLALCEATTLRALHVTPALPLAPQLTAPLPYGVFHDLRWVLAYANSWPALALELAAVVVFRSLLGVLFITLAWPSKTRLPRRLFVNFALATVVGLVVL